MIQPEDNSRPNTQSSAAGGPPRPPKKTAVGFPNDDDDTPNPMRALSVEERHQLAEWLKKKVGKPDEHA